MRALVTISVVLAAALVLAAPALAEIAWDGTGSLEDKGYVLSGGTANGERIPFAWDTPTSGTAVEDTTAAANRSGYYKLSGSGLGSELTNSAGWAVEWRVETLQNTGDHFGVYLAAADNVGGIGVLMLPDKVEWFDGAFDAYTGGTNDGALITSAITAGYHTMGITVAANATVAHLWVDSVDQGTIALNGGTSAVAVGDCSSGSAGQANWDYLNINKVPEPSAIALLVSGLLGLLCHAWRKQK